MTHPVETAIAETAKIVGQRNRRIRELEATSTEQLSAFWKVSSERDAAEAAAIEADFDWSEIAKSLRGDIARLQAQLDKQRKGMAALQAAIAKMSHRRCWDCGHVAYYPETILPYCKCEKCGSADTRVVREAPKEGYGCEYCQPGCECGCRDGCPRFRYLVRGAEGVPHSALAAEPLIVEAWQAGELSLHEARKKLDWEENHVDV